MVTITCFTERFEKNPLSYNKSMVNLNPGELKITELLSTYSSFLLLGLDTLVGFQ